MGPGQNRAHKVRLWCVRAVPLSLNIWAAIFVGCDLVAPFVTDTSDSTHNHQMKAHQ